MNSRNASIQDLSDNHIVEILVKLPVKTIVHCKCVCRDWLNLITDSYFISLHLSKSAECFMFFDKYIQNPITKPKRLRLVEIEEEHGHNHLHHDPIMCLDLNLDPVFRYPQLFAVGSVNGLICLSGNDYRRDNIYICNPINREYMILSKRMDNTKSNIIVNYYGFGVSLLSGEYKVIRVIQNNMLSRPVPYVEIYTLGTGQWRSLTLGHGSLKDGSILVMVYGAGQLLVYHPHTCTTRETVFSHVDAISYRPSFLKLQNFESETVHKFRM